MTRRRKTIYGILLTAFLGCLLLMKPVKAAEITTPFYGIWCQADKDYNEALRYASIMSQYGCAAQVFTTTDWSNLNSEKWYVVTAGVYYSEESANAALASVRRIYPDAYVKYTGYYQGAVSQNVPQYTQSAPSNSNYSNSTQVSSYSPFYGIWCHAAKRLEEAQDYASRLMAQGFSAKVYLTTEWSNLNTEAWYVVSAGAYGTEAAAQNVLYSVKNVYPDAYVKYSGQYKG